MASWRFRQCPKCLTVHGASDFVCLDYGANWNEHGYARRVCPTCGLVASTIVFRIVEQTVIARTAAPKKAVAFWVK